MFCIQCRTATLKLMNPPIIDSTYDTKITADDLPLITICPVDQMIDGDFKILEYCSLKDFLHGRFGIHCDKPDYISWGGHKNISFSEALKVLYDESVLSSIYVAPENVYDSRVVFLAKFGLCLEIFNYNLEYIEIFQEDISKETKNLRLIFTDKTYRSFYMPDISSHLGGEILVQSRQQINYDIYVKKTSSCKILDEKAENFPKCIETGLETRINKPLGCIPPWLSDKNQCNGTYPANFLAAIPDFLDEFLWPVYTFATSKLESECKISCNRTKYLAVKREYMKDELLGAAYVSFIQNVEVTERVASYSLFDFIVDVGSSMGLWLGLSVFGLYDLAKNVVDFIKNSDIFKKMNSALSK